MPYEAHKILHLWGIITLSTTVGAIFVQVAATDTKEIKFKRLLMILHGLGMLAVVLTGFALLNQQYASEPLPNWVRIKIFVVAALGVSPSIVFRYPKWARRLWPLLIILILIGLAAVIARPLT